MDMHSQGQAQQSQHFDSPLAEPISQPAQKTVFEQVRAKILETMRDTWLVFSTLEEKQNTNILTFLIPGNPELAISRLSPNTYQVRFDGNRITGQEAKEFYELASDRFKPIIEHYNWKLQERVGHFLNNAAITAPNRPWKNLGNPNEYYASWSNIELSVTRTPRCWGLLGSYSLTLFYPQLDVNAAGEIHIKRTDREAQAAVAYSVWEAAHDSFVRKGA
jgi:hypothetical protein